MTITQTVLLDALRAARVGVTDDAEDAATVGELADALRASGQPTNPTRIRNMLRVLIADGRAECIKVARRRLDDIVTPVNGYRLK